MTRVQTRNTIVVAALALIIGCALAFAAPLRAQAVPVVVAGDTPATAKLMDFTKKRNLTAEDPSCSFASKEMSKFYKFTTSARNSSYRVSLEDLTQQDFDVRLYDAQNRLIPVSWNTSETRKMTYDTLDRNATYYIELRRWSDWEARADYTIVFKEIITPPSPVKKLKAKSYSTSKLTVSYRRAINATGYQVRTKRGWGDSGKSTYLKTKKLKVTYKTNYNGKKHPYLISVRPYRVVNGKTYYGAWCNEVTAVVK